MLWICYLYSTKMLRFCCAKKLAQQCAPIILPIREEPKFKIFTDPFAKNLFIMYYSIFPLGDL